MMIPVLMRKINILALFENLLKPLHHRPRLWLMLRLPPETSILLQLNAENNHEHPLIPQ